MVASVNEGLSSLLGGEDKNILSTGNNEIDKKIADGIPLGSLTLIEGENDTGKSVLTQQIIWGAMKQGFRVDLYSTELTAKSFLSQMESMSLDVSDYFAWGYIRLFHLHMAGFKWTKEEMDGILQRIVNHIRQSKADVVIIDSLTMFTEYTEQSSVLSFLTNCKNLVDHGKTILITLHTYAFEEDTLIRIRSICDAHLSMKKALIGDKYVMVLEVVKVRAPARRPGTWSPSRSTPGTE